MRCDMCPLSNPEDVCPEAEGQYGIKHEDGTLGCRHPRNWVEKRDAEYDEYIGAMGLDMGIEMDLTPDELERALAICEHMVGLDYQNHIIDTERHFTRHIEIIMEMYRKVTRFWTNYQKNCSSFTKVSAAPCTI